MLPYVPFGGLKKCFEYLTFLVQQQWHPVGRTINPKILYKLNEWGLTYPKKMFLVIHGHFVRKPYIWNSPGITACFVVKEVNRQSQVASCLTEQDTTSFMPSQCHTLQQKKLLVRKVLLILQIRFFPNLLRF